jgi:hypothetical protein
MLSRGAPLTEAMSVRRCTPTQASGSARLLPAPAAASAGRTHVRSRSSRPPPLHAVRLAAPRRRGGTVGALAEVEQSGGRELGEDEGEEDSCDPEKVRSVLALPGWAMRHRRAWSERDVHTTR